MDTAILNGMADGEEYIAPQPQPQRWGKAALAVGAACALLLVGFATGSQFRLSQAFSNEVAPLGLSQMAVIPPWKECARTGANCLAQKCCKTTGYQCYEVHSGFAKCMKSCTPGTDGHCYLHAPAMVPSTRSPVTDSGNSLFCFTFHMVDTGNTKPSFELDLLRTQLFLGASIFGCEEFRVYSDVESWLSPSPKVINTIKVNDNEGNFHFHKRKKAGTWINSNMFIATWKMIKAEGAWSKWDYTVKVDPSTVFLPMRLRRYLDKVEVTDKGIYLENCKFVNYGFFGSLAVISHDAAATYMANIDDCKTALNYMGPKNHTCNEPMGEDLFQQRCMDLHGIDKVGAYDITTDASCAAWRPEGQKYNAKWHPDCAVTRTPGIHAESFKKPKDYFNCLKATQR